jgi:hypothetical protein
MLPPRQPEALSMRIGVIIACVLVLIPCAGFAQQLDEPTVLKLVSDFDQAIARKDPDGLAGFLSDGVSIVANVRASGQNQRLAMNKSTYVETLRQGWAIATNYSYRRENVSVTLSGTDRAIVTATVKETMTARGQIIFSSASETTVIELEAGKPVITSIVADVEMTREQRVERGPPANQRTGASRPIPSRPADRWSQAPSRASPGYTA